MYIIIVLRRVPDRLWQHSQFTIWYYLNLSRSWAVFKVNKLPSVHAQPAFLSSYREMAAIFVGHRKMNHGVPCLILPLKEGQGIGTRGSLQAQESDSTPNNHMKERVGEGPPASQDRYQITTSEGLPASHGGSQITRTTRGESPELISAPSRDEVNSETY